MVVVSSSFSAPTEGIILQTPETKLLLKDKEIGTGTLYITENNVVWGGGVATAGGPSPTISLMYPSISLHAIQRDPFPALYMVINFELDIGSNTPESGGGDTNEDDDDEDDDFDGEDGPITQLRFVPQNEADLQVMYVAMSQGQALHPDPADEVDDDPYLDGEEFDEGDDEFEDAEESNGGPDDAASRLRQMRLENSNGVHYEDCEDADIEE